MSVRGWSAIGLMALVLGLGGCGTVYPPLAEPESGIDTPYLVGPGDTVNIVVWRNPDLSLTVPVRPDGKISTPLVEDLPASGQTAAQLARNIEKVLAKYDAWTWQFITTDFFLETLYKDLTKKPMGYQPHGHLNEKVGGGR